MTIIVSPEQWQMLQPPRVESYTAQLLNGSDQLLRDLHEFSGGTYEQNAFAEVKVGGTCLIKYTSETDIDWGSNRIMLWADINDVRWPLGVFIIEAPQDQIDDEEGTVTTEIRLLDKLAVLMQDAVDQSFSLPEGAVITEAVRAQIIAAGEFKIAVTDSDLTMPAGRVWEVGTSRLQIINDLLGMINYSSLWCDGYGYYRAEPFTRASDRAVAYTFASGDDSLHIGEWSREENWFDVPNRTILITQGDDESPALTSMAQNINGNDNLPYRYSQEARGRVIATTNTGVEAASQEVLDEMAMRSLRSSSTRVTNLTVSHAMVPLWTADLVRFVTPMYRGTATVSKFSVHMTPGSLCQATWREVSREDIS